MRHEEMMATCGTNRSAYTMVYSILFDWFGIDVLTKSFLETWHLVDACLDMGWVFGSTYHVRRDFSGRGSSWVLSLRGAASYRYSSGRFLQVFPVDNLEFFQVCQAVSSRAVSFPFSVPQSPLRGSLVRKTCFDESWCRFQAEYIQDPLSVVWRQLTPTFSGRDFPEARKYDWLPTIRKTFSRRKSAKPEEISSELALF